MAPSRFHERWESAVRQVWWNLNLDETSFGRIWRGQVSSSMHIPVVIVVLTFTMRKAKNKFVM